VFVVELQQADPVRDMLACRLHAFALQLRGGQVRIVLDYRRDRQREKVNDVIGDQRFIGGVRSKYCMTIGMISWKRSILASCFTLVLDTKCGIYCRGERGVVCLLPGSVA
jgi:hypothetical protein